MPAHKAKLALAIQSSLLLGLAAPAQAEFPEFLSPLSLNGDTGFRIVGEADDDRAGVRVSAAGDVNGDGIDDLIIGAPDADPNGNLSAGRSYVVFGSDTGLPNPFDLSTLNGLNGFVLNGIAAGDFSGAVSGTGDVNGDGIDDLVIGAPFADPNGDSAAGRSYVVFGSDTGLPNPFNLSAINGLNGFVLNGEGPGDRSGFSVSAAGDVNGDGIDDLIVGGDRANDGGRGYVVFGSDTAWPNPFNLADINGLNGFILNGESVVSLGRSVSAAGDINGDGLDDLIIGASFNDTAASGRSYVVFGSNKQFPNPFNVSDLNGLNGFALNGEETGDRAGSSVSAGFDLNGDGLDDLIIGAPRFDNANKYDTGRSYVVFGADGPWPDSIDLSTLDGTNGFKFTGIYAGDRTGNSVSAAGDINGDGVDDIIIGAPDFGIDPSTGSSYVIFGRASRLFQDRFEEP